MADAAVKRSSLKGGDVAQRHANHRNLAAGQRAARDLLAMDPHGGDTHFAFAGELLAAALRACPGTWQSRFTRALATQ